MSVIISREGYSICTRPLLVSFLLLLLISQPALSQDCIYVDEFGVSKIINGGEGFASLVGMVDPDGSRFGIPSDFNTWDLDEDGVLDRVQFELLTNILCLPSNTPHPTINFAEIQATYADNVALYWNMVNSVKDAEQAMIAGAPAMLAASIELRAAATAAGVLGNPLPAGVFGAQGTPPEWENATWLDLVNVLETTGEGILWMTQDNYIGPGGLIWVFLLNEEVAYFAAALLGLNSAFTTSFFEISYLTTLRQFLTLSQIDWNFIWSQFPGLENTIHDLVYNHVSYGLVRIGDVEAAINAIGLDTSVLPEADMLAITSNGEDALHSGVLWDNVTLLEMYLGHGGDINAIWSEIEEQIANTLLPAASMTSLLLLAGVYVTGGALMLRRRNAKR